MSIYYRLASQEVSTLWLMLRDVGKTQLAEVNHLVATFLQDRTQLAPITAQELLEELQAGSVIVLDVRPTEEYQAGHLPQAMSLPLADLENRLADLPQDREIVAYCRGPYCVFADEAVALLRTRGYRARRLEQGLPDWRSLGLPVEL